jgi:hypothetical protein
VTDEVVLAYRVRDLVPLKKLLKVRWAVLKMQTSFFCQKRSYGYLLFSVISFALRLVKDLFNTKFRLNKITDHDSESFYQLLNLNEKK